MAASALAKALQGAIGKNATRTGIKNWMTTGIPELDAALSGLFEKGGVPGGRMIEIFGPASSGKTFLATMIMAAAQQMGGIAGFSDHERSFEPGLAESLGLCIDEDTGTWVYKKPETFEESIQLAMAFCEFVRKNKLIPDEAPLVWVFDSVASMVPYDKLYDDKGKRRVDRINMKDKLALATATSQNYPQLAQFAEDYNMTVILLNQVRMKPGVMYGDPTCLHGNVKVPFVDGSYATMREIVEQRIEKDVWAFNEQTGQFEAKPIIEWHDNGEIPDVADWIHIETRGVHTRNGRVGFTATPDHKVLTAEGKWVTAAELSVGDKLISRRASLLNGTLEEVEIVEIRPLGEKAALRNRNRYDITVADHHNYMVGSRQNGVVVHNCTPGGQAAEFYASIRISLGRKMITNGKSGDDKETLGQEITANVIKNKVTRPFQKAKWRVMYNMTGKGATVDVVGSTVDYLVRKSLLPRDGNYLVWEGKKLYQSALEKKLADDPDAMKKLRAFLPDSVEALSKEDAPSETLPTEGGETEVGEAE